MKTLMVLIPIGAISGILLFSCDFPYQPQRFELPAIPSPFISPDSIRAFMGTSKVKIAYTIKEGSRWIYFIDFSIAPPTPVRLKKPRGKEAINGDSPLISPGDGSFVTYYLTQGADIQGAYMQRLDAEAEPILIAEHGTEPHWWVDPAGKIYIIYSNRMISSSLAAGHYFTFKQEVSPDGDSLVGSADTIAPYPMNGGLSSEGRFLCTGYTGAAFYDMSADILTNVNEGVQVCNPSINPDTLHPDQMLFLNFYGAQNFGENPFINFSDYPADDDGNVPLHAVCFIIDAANNVRDFIPISLAGGSYQEWQDPEWSNDPDFAIALAIIDEGNADAVVVKNIGDGNRQKDILIVTPGRFKLNYNSTPSLWIGE